MNKLKIIDKNNTNIVFQLYWKEAPITARAFWEALPFETTFYHAKISGEEIWTPNGLALDIPQENASVFVEEGEIILGPIHKRNKISKCMGIMYGKGQLLDCGNIFGKVIESDLGKLKELGDKFWKEGKSILRFEHL